MLLVHGIYRFWQKRVAFRNDYCLSCAQPRRSVQIRSFNVLHIFWIPLIPLGFWKPWYCTACGTDPHSGGTRRSFKWLALPVLLFLAAAFWANPIDREIEIVQWAFRIGAPIGAILTLRYLLRTPDAPTLSMKLAIVSPAADTVCPFCGTTLMSLATECSCPACGVIRL